jgi:hypothetical protein
MIGSNMSLTYFEIDTTILSDFETYIHKILKQYNVSNELYKREYYAIYCEKIKSIYETYSKNPCYLKKYCDSQDIMNWYPT